MYKCEGSERRGKKYNWRNQSGGNVRRQRKAKFTEGCGNTEQTDTGAKRRKKLGTRFDFELNALLRF